MNIGELRIGNYVEVDGKPAIVIAVSVNAPDYLKVTLPGDEVKEIKISEARSIQITPELLEKCCGFDAYGKYRIGIDSHRYFLKIDDGYVVLLNRQNEAIIHFWDVRHLHQLQNLHYALKNKELEIKL